MRHSLTRFAFLVVATIAGVLYPALRAEAESTVTDVCAAMDRVNRSVTELMAAKRIDAPPEPRSWEKGLDLMHVYQLQVACLDRLFELEGQDGIGRIPLMASRTTRYTASDIVTVCEVMRDEIRRLAWNMGVTELPDEKPKWRDKTIDDAFGEALQLHVNLNALTGADQISPDAIYPHIARAVSDAKAILRHIDPAHRYRIDAKQTNDSVTSAELLEQCLATRKTINIAREDLGLEPTPIPENRSGVKRTEDAFVQSQIILAELNLIKLRTGSADSTPLAVPTGGKSATDVYNQAVLLEYLIGQIPQMRRMPRRAESPTLRPKLGR